MEFYEEIARLVVSSERQFGIANSGYSIIDRLELKCPEIFWSILASLSFKWTERALLGV